MRLEDQVPGHTQKYTCTLRGAAQKPSRHARPAGTQGGGAGACASVSLRRPRGRGEGLWGFKKMPRLCRLWSLPLGQLSASGSAAAAAGTAVAAAAAVAGKLGPGLHRRPRGAGSARRYLLRPGRQPHVAGLEGRRRRGSQGFLRGECGQGRLGTAGPGWEQAWWRTSDGRVPPDGPTEAAQRALRCRGRQRTCPGRASRIDLSLLLGVTLVLSRCTTHFTED